MPRCGLYKTTGAIGAVPAGRLVYFHNHGDPGPGLYLPERWAGNRAQFARSGVVLDDPGAVRFLSPLPTEGFYCVAEPFYCCEQRCRHFETDTLVQLGYDVEPARRGRHSPDSFPWNASSCSPAMESAPP